ncbi:hypothetical protein F4810DRAFT_682823 [Camillea tinctor]|nr:hypothetical protein F4810DRAFT_682823 [Camillea tinctor]
MWQYSIMSEFSSTLRRGPSPSTLSLPPQSRQQRRHRRRGPRHRQDRRKEKITQILQHNEVTSKLDIIYETLGRLVEAIIEDKTDRTVGVEPPFYYPYTPIPTGIAQERHLTQRQSESVLLDSPSSSQNTVAAFSPSTGGIIEDRQDEPRISCVLLPTEHITANITSDLFGLQEDLTKATQDLGELYRAAESIPVEVIRDAVCQLTGTLSGNLSQSLAHLQATINEQYQAGLHEYLQARSSAAFPSPIHAQEQEPTASPPSPNEFGSAAEPPTPASSLDRLPEVIPTLEAPSDPALAALRRSDTMVLQVPKYGATRDERPTPVYPGINRTNVMSIKGRIPVRAEAEDDWFVVEDRRTMRKGKGGNSRASL